MKNSEVKDKVAIVTGAAGGLGFGVAARLAEEQAVLLTDINAKLLGEAAAKLAANGATVAHVTCDVSDRASVQAAFAATEDQLGEVTALANVRLKDIAAARVRYGCRRLHVLLRREAGR